MRNFGPDENTVVVVQFHLILKMGGGLLEFLFIGRFGGAVPVALTF